MAVETVVLVFGLVGVEMLTMLRYLLLVELMVGFTILGEAPLPKKIGIFKKKLSQTI